MAETVDQDFTGGMVSDFKTPPPNTFLEVVKIQLFIDQHNTYSFESVKGNVVTVRVTKNYTPSGFAKGTDKIILYSAYTGSNGNHNGEVAKLTFTEQPSAVTVAYTPVYNHVDLAFLASKMIGQEAYIYPENNKTEPSYWTDENSSPKTLNHADPIFSTYIASGALIVGKKYMVLDFNSPVGSIGNILYNEIAGPVFYGPNEVTGTVFTCRTGVTTYTAFNGARVIEYFPVALLDWTPVFQLGHIRFKQWLNGSLNCGSYQYFYQQADSNGFYTKWSAPSRIVQVGTAALPGGNLQDYQATQGHGYNSLVQSLIGNRLTIEPLDINYSRIRVAAVFYNQLYNVSEQPVLIFDGPVTGATMNVDHLSNTALDQLNIIDVQQILLNIKTVGSIASVNEIAFAAKITTEADFNWDPSIGVTAKNIFYDVTTDIVPAVSNPIVYNGHPRADANVLNADIKTKQWYRVLGAAGTNVIYNGVTYGPTEIAGNVFQGVAGVYSYTSGVGPYTVEAIIRIQKYGSALPITSPSSSCLDVPIVNDYHDSKGQACDHYLRSQWRGETYRWGILVHGTTGNPFYVRWLADKQVAKMFQNDPDSGFAMNLGYFANDPGTSWINHTTEYLLRHIGIQFDNIDFQALATDLGITLSNLPNYFSGFSIVRVPRDKTILTQGLLFPTTLESGVVRPQCTNESALDFNGDTRMSNYYCFYSHDYQCGFSGITSIQPGDTLEIEDYIFDDFSIPLSSGYRYGLGGLVGSPFTFALYNKLYKRKSGLPGNATAYGKQNPLTAGQCQFVETGATGQTVDVSNTFDNLALANTFLSASVFQGTSVGARTMLLKTSLAEGGGDDLIYGYGSYGAYPSYNNEKALVNLVRPKTNLYGGSSTAAKARNLYMTTGHYQPFDQAFINYLNSTSGKAAGIANGIQVFGGDAQLNMVDVSRMVPRDSDANSNPLSGTLRFALGIADVYPCEQNLNISLREGRHISKDKQGINFSSTPEQYICNNAYAAQESNIFYPALPDNYKANNKFLYRSAYSLKKIPGELRNSFREYLPGNYKDVDGQRGSITNIRAKGMRLYYWQETAIGTIPINERASVPSEIIGAPLIIGEGGVAQRYDERTNFYGNQHKFGLGESEDGFGWVDFKRRAYCYMNTSQQLAEMSQIKGLLTDFHDLPNVLAGLNDPLGAGGIVTQYDPRYKRMLTSFILLPPQGLQIGYQPIRKTLIFDIVNQQFGGWLTAAPPLSFHFNERLYSITSPQNPILNATTYSSIEPADVVNLGSDFYVCISSYTSANPAISPASDTTHWQRVYSVEEIYQHYVGQVGKFYNIVANGKVKYAVTGNELKNLEKIFDTHRWKASQDFFETLNVLTDSNGGSDTGLATHPDYDYRNKAWVASIPLDTVTGEQMQDYKMIVELIQNNRLLINDPTQSSNKRITLSSVITEFRKAY